MPSAMVSRLEIHRDPSSSLGRKVATRCFLWPASLPLRLEYDTLLPTEPEANVAREVETESL